jgi:hypothetical protein
VHSANMLRRSQHPDQTLCHAKDMPLISCDVYRNLILKFVHRFSEHQPRPLGPCMPCSAPDSRFQRSNTTVSSILLVFSDSGWPPDSGVATLTDRNSAATSNAFVHVVRRRCLVAARYPVCHRLSSKSRLSSRGRFPITPAVKPPLSSIRPGASARN